MIAIMNLINKLNYGELLAELFAELLAELLWLSHHVCLSEHFCLSVFYFPMALFLLL